jgi:branched-chain amino acid aminotransferase
VPSSRLETELIELIRANDLRTDMHIRIQVFVDTDDGSIASTMPVSYVMATMPMKQYFQTTGLNVAVSSWRRISDRSMPPRIKAVPNYHNGRLAIVQAKRDGYDDVVLLTDGGAVAEGPGYAIFIVRDNVLCTPPRTDGILESITRDSVMEIANDLGLRVEQRSIDRSELYLANEAFFCGSAAEVMPILSFDRIPVRCGADAPVTGELRSKYLSLVRGESADVRGWLTGVYQRGRETSSLASPR